MAAGLGSNVVARIVAVFETLVLARVERSTDPLRMSASQPGSSSERFADAGRHGTPRIGTEPAISKIIAVHEGAPTSAGLGTLSQEFGDRSRPFDELGPA